MKLKKNNRDLSEIDEAYLSAKEVIRMCATKNGLYASGGRNGYKGVWSRDSNITLIGASTDPEDFFREQFKKSLETLKKHQSKLGEIPNAVLKFDSKKLQVDYKSIDSSLWFVIGHYIYKKRYNDASLFKKHEHTIKRTIKWIHYRDFGNDVSLEQLPTTDWQDAFPHKYGVAVNTQALYCKVLDLVQDKKKKKKLIYEMNEHDDTNLWNGTYYWAYRWKNHNKYKEIGPWFDSLGNILAALFDLADRKKARKIVKYMEKHNVSSPFPTRSISPPIRPGGEFWKDYYYDARATPNHYLNGGIWPFIGGFYVVLLVKLKEYKKARAELEKLARGNLKSHVFPEWIDPITKNTYGEYQAWSAGTYIWAYNAVKYKKTFL